MSTVTIVHERTGLLVGMSAICLDVFTNLSWVPEHKFNQVEQPIEVHAVGSGDMSHGRSSHRCLRKQKRDVHWLEMCAIEGTKSMMSISIILLSAMSDFVVLGWLFMGSLTAGGSNTPGTVSHTLSAGSTSNLRPGSHKILHVSVLLCETAVWHLQVQLIGTNVLLPRMHNTPP